MSFKHMSGAQHMSAEVARMSAQVFNQYNHLADMGSMIGYGLDDKEPLSDDPMEALILDLLSMDAPSSLTVEAVVMKHMSSPAFIGIQAIARSADRQKV